VCGEAAADPLLATVLVGMGVTSLSTSQHARAGVHAELAATSMDECRRRAAAVRAARTAQDARAAVAGRAEGAG
jgi:phosphotransferase system enzyme I (PtsI)